MKNDPIVIVSIARTPIGNLLGELKSFSATELGKSVISAVCARAKVNPANVNEVLMGCVLPAGLGQAPARQAALHAGIPTSAPCTTLNKVCGSAMKAIMIAHDSLLVHSTDLVIAGGMESMTHAPYLLKKARQGYRLGHDELFDHMMLDGLEDAYDQGKPMGYFAEGCAEKYGFTRKQQDDYAASSLERARCAIRNHLFEREIVPLTVKTKQGEQVVDKDERPFSVNPEKIAQLSPVFKKDGSITPGNSSSIADGAAAVALTRLSVANQQGLTPLAIICAHTSFSQAPSDFPTAPIYAIKSLLQKVNWQINAVDLFEINEAFAVVALSVMRELSIPRDKLNIHGGACALGHPIGATGARILVTLIAALRENNLKRGIASLCIGGGEATALAIEIIS